ncbi:eukaryotic translation initiation factor 4E family member 1c isoform X3 [Hemitrygon akajei]|uniref:eukaryotic translation initiation factor 4E family member 1c isoform X3 n=1 Tax=Hemitrygon akajei TaxID=2704970 RepID=UPI003BF9590F
MATAEPVAASEPYFNLSSTMVMQSRRCQNLKSLPDKCFKIPLKKATDKQEITEVLETDRATPDACSENATQDQYLKHPLQNRWALWYFKNDKSKSWTENLRLIAKFDTVEDFWALYNHIQQPSKLLFGCDYCLFKDGIKPMWEDDKNKKGGRWLMTLNKQQRHNDLDRYWLETLLCLIGEAFEYSDEVCGAVVNVRPKGDKIAIWTENCQNREAVVSIGHLYKERLGLSLKTLIGYQSHDDTSSKSGSTTKNLFSV